MRWLRRSIRSGFFQGGGTQFRGPAATYIVGQMDKPFEIDQKAREQGLSREGRHALRLEKALPSARDQIPDLAGALGRSGKRALAKACNTLTGALDATHLFPEISR